jgi:hypothetical protein
MKILTIISAVGLMASHAAFGQYTLVFDQQSSDESRVLEGGYGLGVATARGVQSFTPTLDAIGFVRLVAFVQSTSVFAVNVRSGSPSGPILGTTDRVTVQPSGSQAPITFVFSTPVGLSVGSTVFRRRPEPTGL